MVFFAKLQCFKIDKHFNKAYFGFEKSKFEYLKKIKNYNLKFH